MRKGVLAVIWVGVMAGCASEPDYPPAPDAAMARATGVSAGTLQQGRAVYMTDCTRCHEAKMPNDVSVDDWHVVLPGMAWNSGISAADEEAVEAYILAVRSR